MPYTIGILLEREGQGDRGPYHWTSGKQKRLLADAYGCVVLKRPTTGNKL